MLTISLDEYGEFENYENAKRLTLIAGVIYDDQGNKEDTKNERRRIEAYYRKVIEEAKAGNTSIYADSFVYPNALHSDGDSQRDHYVIGPVKEIVSKTLSEFLQKGTFDNERIRARDNAPVNDRKGKYYLFVIVKSGEGIESLLDDNINILSKDNYASNLYYHMSSTLINRLLFHNPLIGNVKDVSLNLATRASRPYRSMAELSEYKRQGYLLKSRANDDYYVQITNPDSYRALIAEEMLRTNNTRMKISAFEVKSIKYEQGKRDMEFLFLSDSLCSILGRLTTGQKNVAIETISNKMDQLNNANCNLVFGYDKVDVLFAEAWKKLEEGDYYSALSLSYDMGVEEGTYAKYYQEHWKTIIEKKIQESDSFSAFSVSVHKLVATLYTNILDQNRCLYILNHLERLGRKLEKENSHSKVQTTMYDLYDAGVSAYCHIGNSKIAELYFKRCMEYAKTVDLSSVLRTRNRMVVFLCDSFDYKGALEIADVNVGYQELIHDMRKEIDPENDISVYSVNYGKSLSQRAQVYAFLRDPRAEDDFHNALSKLPKGSEDYKISQSYLLHYYLDNGYKDKYLKEAADYFGNSTDISKQLSYIITEGAKENPVINAKYALYVFIRGLYVFRFDEITDQTWKQLTDFEKNFGKAKEDPFWNLGGHPSELIFKYMNLLHIKKFHRANSKYEKKMVENIGAYGSAVDAIMQYAKIEFDNAEGDNAQRDENSNKLCLFLRENFVVFKDRYFPETGEDRWKELNGIFTFMYR